MNSAVRIVFLGTGDIALPTFVSLLGKEGEHEVVGLVTQPDRPVGRKQILCAPKVKEVALESKIPVFQPEDIRNKEEWRDIEALKADVFVVMAYGQILTQAFIDLPRVACINLHASLLPRWRGASCIQAAIREGDSETGITAMHVVRALDAGNIIVQTRIKIEDKETGGELHDRLAEVAPRTLLEALACIKDSAGSANGTPQKECLVTYAPKLVRGDGLLDWKKSARCLSRLIRAYHPWPGSYTKFLDRKGRMRNLKVYPPLDVREEAQSAQPGTILSVSAEGLEIACGRGSLLVKQVQPEGSGRLEGRDFLNGLGSEVSILGEDFSTNP